MPAVTVTPHKHFAEKDEFASPVQWTEYNPSNPIAADCEGFYIKCLHFSRMGYALSDEFASDFGHFTTTRNLQEPNLFGSQDDAAEIAAHISSGSNDGGLEMFLVMHVTRKAGKFHAKPVGPLFACGQRL
jgi:hypothetical protein